MPRGALRYVAGTAQPIEPQRADYAELNDAEFADLVRQYKIEKAEFDEAAKGVQGKNTDDVMSGPGKTGWVNPDSITGPGV